MINENPSVYAMVHKVLTDSKEKLASSSSGKSKTAAVAKPQTDSAPPAEGVDFLKIADACEHLAKNIHLVNDERTPQEKLAEYSAIHQELKKLSEAPAEPSKPSDSGDNSKGPHQTQKAPSEADPPATVGNDDSGTGVGQGNAIPSEETNTPGTTPLSGGDSGQASAGHVSPKSVTPNEKANPQDAANALESNQEMMMADQPEDVLKQAAAKSPTFRRLVDKENPLEKVADRARKMKQVSVLLQKAAQANVPNDRAIAMIRAKHGDELAKLAEDAINPAQISGGNTEPLLQSEPGTPSPLMQGSTVGTNTPRETAPTSGEGGGRELLSSVESAINATKGQAKKQNKGALAELLTEPAMSAAHDQTLNKSLDSTSSAGVKISSAQANAARELLRKFQDGSPGNAQKLAAAIKQAQGEEEAMGGGAAPAEAMPMPEEAVPPEAAMEAEGAGEAPEVSDEALEAVKSGVTAEELAQAEQLLALQGAAAAAAEEDAVGAEGAVPPEAGDPEKDSQMMGMSPSPGQM